MSERGREGLFVLCVWLTAVALSAACWAGLLLVLL